MVYDDASRSLVLSFKHADRYEPIGCPDCGNDKMQKVEFNIHTGIVLDYCSACEGFWLDGFELDRINHLELDSREQAQLRADWQGKLKRAAGGDHRWFMLRARKPI